MPEPEDILAMSETNPDGGGVSWWDEECSQTSLKVVGFIFSHWSQPRDAPCLTHSDHMAWSSRVSNMYWNV